MVAVKNYILYPKFVEIIRVFPKSTPLHVNEIMWSLGKGLQEIGYPVTGWCADSCFIKWFHEWY